MTGRERRYIATLHRRRLHVERRAAQLGTAGSYDAAEAKALAWALAVVAEADAQGLMEELGPKITARAGL